MKPQATQKTTKINKQQTSVHERFDSGPRKFTSYFNVSPKRRIKKYKNALKFHKFTICENFLLGGNKTSNSSFVSKQTIKRKTSMFCRIVKNKFVSSIYVLVIVRSKLHLALVEHFVDCHLNNSNP